MLKRTLRTVLPVSTLQWLRSLRAQRANQRIAKLPPSEAFDIIYRNGWWGDRERPSGHGSYGVWADAFVDVIVKLVEAHGLRRIVDIGCGDFNIGRRIAPKVDSYLGLDVSSFIVERNKNRFFNMENVTFERFNLIERRPPPTDLIIVRQVLLHLTNQQIESALVNLETSDAKWIIVAEDVFRGIRNDSPNTDLPHVSVGTRSNLGSGILLNQPPFKRRVELITSIPEKDWADSGPELVLQRLLSFDDGR